MKPDDIMPLICLRCKKDIPLTIRTMEEISYTHYSYCEDCLREGLKLLKAKDKEKEMPIKLVDEIPLTVAEQRESYRERIRQDICYAITNRISTFEFDGDYNYKYLANYAREEASHIFIRMIYRDASRQVRKTLAEKLQRKYVFQNPNSCTRTVTSGFGRRKATIGFMFMDRLILILPISFTKSC